MQEQCRTSLANDDEQRALCRRKILAAHLLDGATGWYVGTVQHFGVGSSWRQPDATHIIMYSQKETGTKHLAGRVGVFPSEFVATNTMGRLGSLG